MVGDWNSRPESTSYLLAKHQRPVTEEFMKIEFQLESHEKMKQKRLAKLPLYSQIFEKLELKNQYDSAYQNYYSHEDFSIRTQHGDRHPKATNFKLSFKDTLDYIFHDKSLELTKILEIDESLYQSEGHKQGFFKRLIELKPSKRAVDSLGAVPSSFHPSDHVPLMAFFKFK